MLERFSSVCGINCLLTQLFTVVGVSGFLCKTLFYQLKMQMKNTHELRKQRYIRHTVTKLELKNNVVEKVPS